VTVTVTFNQNAPTGAPTGGTLTLTFTPTNPSAGGDDGINLDDGTQTFWPFNPLPQPAVETFNVAAGSSSATFGTQGAPSITFNTGTTAGTFTLTAAVGDDLDQWGPYTIAPAAPVIAPGTSTLLSTPATAGGTLQLTFKGYDNTQATSGLTFEFYATDGTVVSPGLISLNNTDPANILDATSDFSQYYQASPLLAGMFQVTATFPITGDITQIANVVVTLSNPTGPTQWTVPVQQSSPAGSPAKLGACRRA
jgi:hypothetical protein